MLDQVENEYKRLISEKKYKEILTKFDFEEEFEQINHYYINEKIKKNDITIRVREFCTGQKKLQIKLADKKQSRLFVSRKELEYDILDIPKYLDLNKIPELEKIEIGVAKYLGKLHTKRFVCCTEKVQIMLDKNYYLNVIDYELEVEFDLVDKDSATIVLKKVGLEKYINTFGKFKRFLNQHQK